jgi:pimeloyl-ACP methyl ester carboxylesterase
MPGLPEQLGFETAFFDLPGARLHAALAGPTGGPLVILLHGFPEFWYEWRHQLGPLAAAGYRVIAPDQRGYNLSTKVGPFDLQTLAGDIAHLIERAGVESAHIVGHDWGGAVAWALAAWHPQQVRRLLVINLPNPLAMSAALRQFNLRQYLRSTYVAYFQLPRLPEWSMRRNHFELMRRGLSGSALPGAFGADDLERLKAAWAQPGALSAMLGWYRAVGASWRQVSASQAQFSRITAPALLLWGARDIALGVELAEASRQYMANGRLVCYPEHTHWLPAEGPAVVTRQMLAHFAET